MWGGSDDASDLGSEEEVNICVIAFLSSPMMSYHLPVFCGGTRVAQLSMPGKASRDFGVCPHPLTKVSEMLLSSWSVRFECSRIVSGLDGPRR